MRIELRGDGYVSIDVSDDGLNRATVEIDVCDGFSGDRLRNTRVTLDEQQWLQVAAAFEEAAFQVRCARARRLARLSK